MNRCPACGTAFIHGGEFCTMDGSRLVAVPTPVLTAAGDVTGDAAHDTLVAGALHRDDARPTEHVKEEHSTGAVGGGVVTLALSMGDTGLIGAVLADRYKLEGLIGRGGMGVVYRARHLLLERAVAVKLLRPQYLSDERAVARFLREAQAMARVEHLNAVTIHDFGRMPDGGAYLVMEFIEGDTLRTVLSRVGLLPIQDVVRIVEQVCGAVDAAHRQGVVHRDIKPENIMFKRVDDGAVVKVVDFGLAKVVETETAAGKPVLTSAGDLFGTPAYMAPEFFEGEPVGSAADVYSIGILAYEMLSGAPPFQGTVQSVMSGHLFKEAPSLVTSAGRLTPEIDHVIRKALSKKPRERYETAGEFAARLAGVLAGEEVQLDPDEKPTVFVPSIEVDTIAPDTFVPDGGAASPDEMETYGGPKRIVTGGLVPPDAETPVVATEHVTAPPPRRYPRRRVAALGLAVVAGLSLGVVVFSVASRLSTRADIEPQPAAAEPAPPAPTPLPLAEPEPADDSVASEAGDPPVAVDTESTPPDDGAASALPQRQDERASAADGDPKPAGKQNVRDDKNDKDAKDAKSTKNAKDAGDKSQKKRKWYNPKTWF